MIPFGEKGGAMLRLFIYVSFCALSFQILESTLKKSISTRDTDVYLKPFKKSPYCLTFGEP